MAELSPMERMRRILRLLKGGDIAEGEMVPLNVAQRHALAQWKVAAGKANDPLSPNVQEYARNWLNRRREEMASINRSSVEGNAIANAIAAARNTADAETAADVGTEES